MALREKMLEMLDSTRVEEEVCEISGQMLVMVSFARMNKSNVYIVAENDLHTYVRLFKSWGLHVHKVVRSLPKDFQRVDDVDIVSLESLLTDDTPRKFFLVFFDADDDTKDFLWNQIDKIPSAPHIASFAELQESQRLNLNSVDKFDSNSMFYYQSHKR